LHSKILLVDDDIDYCYLLSDYLSSEGFDIEFRHDGKSGLDVISEKNHDLAVLDMMMPEMTGLEVLKKVRQCENNIPIIMLTAKGDEIDRIVGLELGADDYVSKPCSPRELVARIKAILKRRNGNNLNNLSEGDDISIINIADLTIDCNLHAVSYNSESLELTTAEYSILLILVENIGKVISKSDLSERALSKKLSDYDRSIDMHISNIRAKLQSKSTKKLDLIKTIRSVGYVYMKP
jgi:DNA-binding response OmpR family regulator